MSGKSVQESIRMPINYNILKWKNIHPLASCCKSEFCALDFHQNRDNYTQNNSKSRRTVSYIWKMFANL